MEVTVNGNNIKTGAFTLENLIIEQEIPTEGLAVAIGQKVISRRDWSETPLMEGMAITLIRATQGG